jgi:hypothetical protein
MAAHREFEAWKDYLRRPTPRRKEIWVRAGNRLRELKLQQP